MREMKRLISNGSFSKYNNKFSLSRSITCTTQIKTEKRLSILTLGRKDLNRKGLLKNIIKNIFH